MTEQQIGQQERELDYWMTRAYEAEGKLWKAEKRLAEWMEHWNTTARTGAVDEIAAILEANARADQAEARVKAVEDVLDAEEARPRPIGCGYDTRTTVRIADIRRALESVPPPGQ